MLVGLLPLLVVGTAVLVVLAIRFGAAAAQVREATGRATATVERSALGPERREAELRWTDDRGTERTSRVRAAVAGEVPAGTRVELRYVPHDPGRVYVNGDETSARLRDLAYGIPLVTLLIAVVVLVTTVHITRRLAAERRPGTTMPVSYARSRRGLFRRAWLVVDDHGRRWWVPVHWDPLLTRLLAKTPATVHGRPAGDRVVVVDIDSTPVWQAGRRRRDPPGGQILMTAPPWSKSAKRRVDAAATVGTEAGATPPLGLGRQFRTDATLLVAAPAIGLLWAYLDRSGPASLLLATLLAACVLFWLPTILGSDPT